MSCRTGPEPSPSVREVLELLRRNIWTPPTGRRLIWPSGDFYGWAVRYPDGSVKTGGYTDTEEEAMRMIHRVKCTKAYCECFEWNLPRTGKMWR